MPRWRDGRAALEARGYRTHEFGDFVWLARADAAYKRSVSISAESGAGCWRRLG